MTHKPISEHCQVVLLVHGSQSASAQSYYDQLMGRVKNICGKENLSMAYLQFREPNLSEALEGFVKQGAGMIKILPLFLAPGNHIEIDVPLQVADVEERFRNVEIEILPPIGTDERFFALIEALTSEALK